jgi:hypothetical protein
MTRFWGVFLDETRCEFGAPIEAETKEEAWRIAAEDYPESKCVQLESPQDTVDREKLMYERIQSEMDGYDDYQVADDAYDLDEEE